ncbi:MAG: hypothetical protein ACI8WT_001799 [Clostridium sp.]|jgi:hypothetical protein
MENKIKYDKEYSTQYLYEYDYLLKMGIEPSFQHDKTGIRTYKYTKNNKLFMALCNFYKN